MTRSLEVFNELYKPYKITRKNNVFILNTMDGNFAIKENPKIDYYKLYQYLKSRSFNYIPEMSLDSRDDLVVLEYQDDLSIDKEQKALDLINIVGLLHSKTSYFKNVTNDKYKEVYDKILKRINYINMMYEEFFLDFLNEEYLVPSHYLFLRNYTLIYKAFEYVKDKLDEWFNLIKDKNSERVVLVHNNLKLEHFIKNENDYLISWDHYIIDTPVLDLYKFYQNEWKDISFVNVIDNYNRVFELKEDEKLLLDILISIPLEVSFKKREIDNVREVRELINYLNSSSKIVFND